MTEPSDAHRQEPERVVIRDKRRVNPSGDRAKPPGRPRAKGPAAGPASDAAGAGGDAGTNDGPAGAGSGGSHQPKHEREQPGPDLPGEVVIEPSGERPGEPAAEPIAAPVDEPEPAMAPPAALGAELEAMRTALDERTRDLQRVTAEYANYRKRVERDRALVGEQATGNVLSALLPVLDDLDRAREHGELVDGVATVAEQLVATLAKFGLTAFGERGDPFDPTRHEAVAHLTSAEVTEPTCIDILRRGYLLGDRLLRPAMVAVADPGEPS